MAPKTPDGTPLGPAFLTIFRTSICWCILVAFWHPWARFWPPSAHFWLPLVPFSLPLARFWHPLAHFWRPLAPFWLHFLILVDFRSLLALFCSLLLPFRLLFLIFNTFWLRFRYFPNPSAKNREINTCTPTSYRFSHTSIFAGPGRINCRRQLRFMFFFASLQKAKRIENQWPQVPEPYLEQFSWILGTILALIFRCFWVSILHWLFIDFL